MRPQLPLALLAALALAAGCGDDERNADPADVAPPPTVTGEVPERDEQHGGDGSGATNAPGEPGATATEP